MSLTQQQQNDLVTTGEAASRAVYAAAEVGQRIIREVVNERWPEAVRAVVEVYLDGTYTERTVTLQDAEGRGIDTDGWPLDTDDDDEHEDWVDVLERAVGFQEVVEFATKAETRAGVDLDPDPGSDGLRTCDTCPRVTDAGEYPDWVNGRCEFCDPSILEGGGRYLGHELTAIYTQGQTTVYVDDVGCVVLGIRKRDAGDRHAPATEQYGTVTDVDGLRDGLDTARTVAAVDEINQALSAEEHAHGL